MAKWNNFKRPPSTGERVIVCFWWPDGEDYQMTMGCWPIDFQLQDWGEGCLPIKWMEAPEYPPYSDLPYNGQAIH